MTLEAKQAAARVADDLFARLSDVRAVFVATEDGFPLAHTTREAFNDVRLAAISSSMSAIGEALSQETDLGAVRCLTIEAEDGYLVMRSGSHQGVGLVVAVIATREMLLGLVINAVGEAVRQFSQ